MLATTASVTEWMRDDIIEKLDMLNCRIVSASPNKRNIFYEAITAFTLHKITGPARHGTP